VRSEIVVAVAWPKMSLEQVLHPRFMGALSVTEFDTQVGMHPQARPAPLRDSNPQPGAIGHDGVSQFLKSGAHHRNWKTRSIGAAHEIRTNHALQNMFSRAHAISPTTRPGTVSCLPMIFPAPHTEGRATQNVSRSRTPASLTA